MPFIFLLGFLNIYAQSNNDSFYFFKNLPTSPSTARFLRYGDIQNSEFTGTNAPKIPLYTVEEGDIKLPLTLDYISGNGIKVADEASSVGLGWNIGFPAIVQSVIGEDDFDYNIEHLKIDLHYQKAPWPALGYNSKYLESKGGKQQPSDYIEQPEIGKYTYYYSIHHTLPVNGFFKTFANDRPYDASPDIFSVNIFGEKLEFFISNHKDLNTANAVPQFTSLKKGYRISFNKATSTFNITNPKGLTFTFGRVEEVKFINVSNRNYVLTGIRDKNNKALTIEYNQYNNVRNFIPNSKNLNYNQEVTANYTYCEGIPLYYLNDNYVASTKLNGVDSVPWAFQTAGVGNYLISISPDFLTVQNYLQISKISGEFGSLNFLYTNREDFPTAKLSKITLKNNINVDIKNIDFEYDYVVAENSPLKSARADLFDDNRMRKRLFLRSLSINQNENYTFAYKNENMLPRKDSYAVDYWGYANGGINNKTYFLNPTDFTGSSLPITDLNNNKKQADSYYTTAGILDRINYPTRGFSEFNYELNSSSNLFSTYNPSAIKNGKGIRLESQTNYDFDANVVDKTKFVYDEGYSTNPLHLITEYTTKYIQSNANQIFATRLVSINSTNNYSVSPLSSGDFVAYKKVTKVEVENSGNNKGKIISNYSINPDAFYQFFTYQLQISIPRTKAAGVENGMLLSQEFINANNQTVRKIINNYNTVYSDIFYGTMFTPVNESLFLCTNMTGGPTAGFGIRTLSIVSHFPIFSKESLLSDTTVTEFFGNQQVTNKTNYLYNSDNFLEQKSVLTSGQDQITENYLYTSQIPRLQQANILSENIGKNISKNGKQIFGQVSRYQNNSHYNPTSILQYDLLANSFFIEGTYDLYDKNNLLQYTAKDGTPTTVLWGYRNTLPIAKVEGASYSQIMQAFGLNGNSSNSYLQLDIVKKSNLDINDTTEENMISALDNFRNKSELKDFQITTYTYDPLVGVKTIIQPSGIREYYKYDSSNRLKQILNDENKIIKEFSYNYSPLRYYNSERSKTFVKNCGNNATGTSFTYVVHANKYVSMISQQDADSQAINDINVNGQNAANSDPNGTCTYISCDIKFNVSGGGGISLANHTNYKVALSFSSGFDLPWKTTGVLVGTINGNCRPSVERTSGAYNQGVWTIIIKTNGDIIAKKVEGTAPNNTTYNLEFTYPTN
ncbi:hypothetical protein CJF12_07000 [Chryseobacterium piperi]|uniref:DUF5977 domain-containing protein n=1 Tax=Chryseobacterium piperi TaxID=558152 RepID=UPI000BAA9DAC|nr:DUF5977 domain-containing protein [Chryseobacterium piperi]ASW74066.1 hypothetical protein CJF12_07000 [Chryseobacterium piperi]